MTSSKVKQNLIYLIKWLTISVVFGACCGIIGFLFFKSVESVTVLRANFNCIVFLLPFGALLSVLINKALKTSDTNTNTVINSVNGNNKLNPKVLPAIFTSAVIAHLLGGSVGREGAALQMGGGAAIYIGKVLKLKNEDLHVLTLVGMGAVFSALFGTPIGACVFVLEVAFSKKIVFKSAIPTLISSFSAYFVSIWLGTHPERFNVTQTAYDTSVVLKATLISVAVGIIGTLFCYALKYCHIYFKKAIKNEYLLIFVGSIIIVLLTAIVGNQDYNGSGNDLIIRTFENGKVNSYDFLLKIIFTVISVSIGLRGGEIVPSFCIGATLGGYLAILFCIDVTIGAALGMAAIFNTVTKCPVATMFICLEMFGIGCMPLCILSIIITVVLSSRNGLYEYKRNKMSLLELLKASRI